MTDQTLIQKVAAQTTIKESSVKEVLALLEEDFTVPFIARYRKDMTGGLDEVQIKDIEDNYTYEQNVRKRKEEVLRLIEEQGKLTPELKKELQEAEKLQRIEDLYRPYKQKRRTRATVAKEKGLEPLAKLIWERTPVQMEEEAEHYLSEENELHTLEDVKQGAQDIVAEWVADEPEYRDYIRNKTYEGAISSEAKKTEKDEKGVYEMYYEFQESLKAVVSHRILALNRGEKEGILKVSVLPPEDRILHYLQRKTGGEKEEGGLLHAAVEDGYKRLIKPSVEREIRNELTEKAEEQAIEVFAKNLRSLLLQPPLRGKTVLGIDPAYRTGCKLAAVDETGKVLDISVIYPTPPRKDFEGAEKKVTEFMREHNIELFAIGNGTASRETEQFFAELIQKHNWEAPYMIVNEAGASVYSASKLAREEFPDFQVEERSAVSIARRVQDPLAELVKIDPKSIGVGQYQHDVTQKRLNESLTFVVETAVNQVGVNANTASSSLLQYVSGLNKTVAGNVVKKRDEKGKFASRKDLKDVPRLGAKTFEQSIGFLRIPEGTDPLDQTPIHPESYTAVRELLKDLGLKKEDIGSAALSEKLQDIDLKQTAERLGVGELTLGDIIESLKKPSRDLRDDLPKPLLKTNVLTMEDLESGMELEGTVRNVVDFGAFVDIGVKQDGLVHISKLANRFIKHPMDVVSVGDVVTVWVEEVDTKKQRVALTMVKKT
ncbi:Tex family protein [Salimicrobium flavidum]|uniref:S1 motif domain-containing protein n=1 Tax=Salimicrobium flavidum TaxID=570947 RepID=A0A1N7K4N9_9BACI|nr:Tex family protein [Salimicrobium flavidum]SIS56572.1 uncharacterized protein SAMN05421687_10915 [Salimicrobium flavidum]